MSKFQASVGYTPWSQKERTMQKTPPNCGTTADAVPLLQGRACLWASTVPLGTVEYAPVCFWGFKPNSCVEAGGTHEALPLIPD